MKAIVLMNDGEGRFDKFAPTDKLVVGGQVEIAHADTIEAMLENVAEIANRMAPDNDGNEWPSNVRSLSVGDVVIVGGYGAFVVDPFGWDGIDMFDVVNAIATGTVSSRGAASVGA